MKSFLHVRTVAVVAAGATLVLGLAACSSTVARGDVAASIKEQLSKQNIQTDTVMCPADLMAEVGRMLRCEFTVDGQPVDALATVTAVEGGTARYDITTEARPVAKDLLARKVSDQVGKQAGVTIESSTCAGDLPPEVTKSVTCTVRGEGETVELTVTVTKVDGGLINYSIEQA